MITLANDERRPAGGGAPESLIEAQATASVLGRRLDELAAGPLTLDVPTAARLLGVSRSGLYEAIKAHRAPVGVITVGSRVRVITASVVTLLGGEIR